MARALRDPYSVGRPRGQPHRESRARARPHSGSASSRSRATVPSVRVTGPEPSSRRRRSLPLPCPLHGRGPAARDPPLPVVPPWSPPEGCELPSEGPEPPLGCPRAGPPDPPPPPVSPSPVGGGGGLVFPGPQAAMTTAHTTARSNARMLSMCPCIQVKPLAGRARAGRKRPLVPCPRSIAPAQQRPPPAAEARRHPTVRRRACARSGSPACGPRARRRASAAPATARAQRRRCASRDAPLIPIP